MGNLCSNPKPDKRYMDGDEDTFKRHIGVSVVMVDSTPVERTHRESILNQDAMTPYLEALKLDKDTLK